MTKKEYKVLKSVHLAMQKGYDNSNGNLPQNLNLNQYFKFRDIYRKLIISNYDNPIHNLINAKSHVEYIYLWRFALIQGFTRLRKNGDAFRLKSVIQGFGGNISMLPNTKCARHSQRHKNDNVPF